MGRENECEGGHSASLGHGILREENSKPDGRGEWGSCSPFLFCLKTAETVSPI